MLMFRRHAFRGDNPEPAGEIKFIPCRTAQFTGTDEQQGNQPQGAPHREIAVMPLKVQHNLTEFPGVERGGSVPCLSGTQRSGQVFRGVPRGLAGGDGIAAYLAADIRQPASSAQFPGLPQRFDGAHNVLGGNVCHGLAAEDGKEIFRHPPHHEGAIAVFTVKGFPLVPFHSHGLERSVGGGCPCGLPVFRRVDAGLEQGLGFIPALPCGAE